MSERRYLSIGYIRSNCLSKVACLIDHLPKTQLHINRSRVERKKIDSNYRWLTYTLEGKAEFDISWSVWKDKVPFQTVLGQLGLYKQKYHLDDFVVGRLEVGITDQKLTELINRHLGHKFKDGTQFFVTFVNKPLCTDTLDGWDADIIREINHNAIVNLKFKRGVLDINSIVAVPSLDFNFDQVLHEKEIIRQILSHLDTKKWFKFPEVEQAIDPRSNQHPYPGVIRTYEQLSGKKWVFLKEEEVR
jgi:hypothetical protein